MLKESKAKEKEVSKENKFKEQEDLINKIITSEENLRVEDKQ